MTFQSDLPIVVGLGELLWDCFDHSRRPGGAPANVAFHANQLGCEGIVCSRVGSDAAGADIVQFLSEQGLRTDFVQRDDPAETGRVTVDTSTPGSPRYIIHENVAWDHLQFDANTAALMQRTEAVCFGTLAQRSAISRDTVQQCLRATGENCLKVFDVNLRQHWYDAETIRASLVQTDCLKVNHEEIRILTELLDFPSGDPAEFAAACREQFDIPLVCITRAEHGCCLIGAEETADVPGSDVSVVDAVGAGDAFTAALIFARLNGWPLRNTAEFANAVGGLVTTRSGAMPALRSEFDALKTRFTRR